MSEFSPEFWAVIGGALFVGVSVSNAASKVTQKLQNIYDRLYDVEEVIWRIPGVESYEAPDGLEWSEQHKRNPGANMSNRRNWVR
jgi:hypothetical protein